MVYWQCSVVHRHHLPLPATPKRRRIETTDPPFLFGSSNGGPKDFGILPDKDGALRRRHHRLARPGPVRLRLRHHQPTTTIAATNRRDPLWSQQPETLLRHRWVQPLAESARPGWGRRRHPRPRRRHQVQRGHHHDAARDRAQIRLRFPQGRKPYLQSSVLFFFFSNGSQRYFCFVGKKRVCFCMRSY